MHNYRVVFVSDHALPEGQAWAMVDHEGTTYCVFKQAHLTPNVVEEAWAAYRILTSLPTPRQPLDV